MTFILKVPAPLNMSLFNFYKRCWFKITAGISIKIKNITGVLSCNIFSFCKENDYVIMYFFPCLLSWMCPNNTKDCNCPFLLHVIVQCPSRCGSLPARLCSIWDGLFRYCCWGGYFIDVHLGAYHCWPDCLVFDMAW